MNSIFNRKTLIATIVMASLGVSAMVANATHSWGGYHWARQTASFDLTLDDNLSSTWDPYLGTTSSDWSVSTVLETKINADQTNKNCRPTAGLVEICSKKYGRTGWLGLAQVWVSGSHITQGIVKLNDTYFGTGSKYDTPAWRNLLVCQEVGHTLGLDHQDEDFYNTNLGTCMDYTNNPSGPPSNEHPNFHDYEQLEAIYSHTTDTSNTAFAPTSSRGNGFDVNTDDPSGWGKEIRRDAQGRSSLFERDLGNGEKLFTYVTWVR